MEKIRYRLVYNRRGQLNRQGEALVQVEASLLGKRSYFTTKVYLRPSQWDARNSTVVNHPNGMDLNAYLYEYMRSLEAIELSIWKRGGTPTLMQLRQRSVEGRAPGVSFGKFAHSVISDSLRTGGTKQSLRATVKMLGKFRSGYEWGDLTYSFLKDFELYLQRTGAATNTVAKHLTNLRTLVNEAIQLGMMRADASPFLNFKIRHERTAHRFLSPDELTKLEKLEPGGRLGHVLHAFLFCCYTGLRYSDFRRLSGECLATVEGNVWLKMKSKKTKVELSLPIYMLFGGKALRLIEQYGSPEKLAKIGSNADTNQRLKEIQRQAGIHTRITFHTARHTCATLLVHQGVPITTVQKLLGHTKISTTQIYSEVMAETVVRDLENVNKKDRKRKK